MSRIFLRKISRWAVVGSLALLGAAGAYGQCTPGDILWVSDAVNADVGANTGVGACTVGGAAYNNIAQPFGLQGAFDCACAGADIRILTGANDYGSSSASWNNRDNATRNIDLKVGASSANPILITGYADSTTPCYSHQTTGCPVTVDFTGNTGDGFTEVGALWLVWSGLRVTGAAARNMEIQNSGRMVYYAMEVDNGNVGLYALNSNTSFTAFLLSHDNVSTGLNPGIKFTGTFTETYSEDADGIALRPGSWFERLLSYESSDNIVASSSLNAIIAYATTANANASSGTGEGYAGGGGDKRWNGVWNVISTQNANLGFSNYAGAVSPTVVSKMSLWNCTVAGGNTGGAYSPASPPAPRSAGIRVTAPDSTTAPTFAGGGNFSVSGVDACEYQWFGSTTTMTSCPGASPDCVGGGLFIQPVR